MAMQQMKETMQNVGENLKEKLGSIAHDEQGHPTTLLPESQNKQPGIEKDMIIKPQYEASWYIGTNKLLNKVAVITGGDSGIGRAVAILYAREGAKIVIGYLNEDEDAEETKKLCEKEGAQVLLCRLDLRSKENCYNLIEQTIKQFGSLDILVNNAGEQHVHKDIREISDDELLSVFSTKFFSMFWCTQAALNYLKEGSCIINTASVNAYMGHQELIDYTASNGAIIAFTRSLALQLASKKIRVNGVSPGPILTPLIPSTFGKESSAFSMTTFGKNFPMQRAGQPEEVSPSYVFLASQDSSYYTGQFLHPNGGKVVNA